MLALRWVGIVAFASTWLTVRAASAADAEYETRHVNAGIRLAPVLFAPAYTAGVGALAGVELSYRITVALRAGVYAEYFDLHSTSSDQLRYEAAETAGGRFGARLELHVLPSGTWDPWLGASFGGFSVRRGEPGSDDENAGTGMGVDLSGELGLDIHFGRFSFGPLVYAVMPVTNRQLFNDGGWLSLIPSLRAQVAF